MAELTEISLELQHKEAHGQIKMHLSKGQKYQWFLSPMFLRRFPAIMENQITVDWNTILGVYDRTPILPITLIDTEILDHWFAHPSVWNVLSNLQQARRMLALICYTLPTSYKGQPAIVFGASFFFIPAYKACMNLHDGLTFLKNAKEDSVVLVAVPAKPTYAPQPRKGRYLTLLPISGNPNVDRGPLHAFAAAGLPVASKERRGGDTSMLQRGPLWKNVHYIERNPNGELVKGATGKPLCQELLINLTSPSGKLEYTPTDRGHPLPLTLAACHPEWDDYCDLTETVTEMAHCLMKEDRQEVAMPPKVSITPKKEAAKSVMALVNEGITWVSSDQFLSDQRPGTSPDNPVHLSDATDASASGSRPRKDDDFADEAKLLGHFSDALHEMAASIVDLEDGYFRALHEVIMETKQALRVVSCINAHYVSQVVMVMSSWQEVVQTAASHMEVVNTTIYLMRHEDVPKATRE